VRRERAVRILCGALLVLAVLAVYAPVARNGFVPIDDDVYITGNPAVLAGLTRAGVAWALTATHGGNWHPLTWISHMADVSLFGADPAAHHLVSVACHAANAVLLLLLLARVTGRLPESALAAALFAVHPLHVESVAWAAERKDVLSALLFLLTLTAYARYAARPGPRRALPVAALFLLGLAAKPMLVTLPFVLLLLDGWPLGRFRAVPARRLLLEKVPLFLLSAGSSAVTYLVQRQEGAMGLLGDLAPGARLANAAVGYAAYLGKTLWPARLAVFYPLPEGGYPAWRVAAAGLLLAALTLLALRRTRVRPWLAAGWLWFLGTLVPVIGLVQVGAQATADRYTYLPLIGLFVAAAWGAGAAARRLRLGGPAAAAAVVLLGVLMQRSFVQAGYWRDGETLLRHALGATRGNWVAHYTLGVTLEAAGRAEEALAEYRQAALIHPRSFWVNNNLARLLAQQGRIGEAIPLLEAAVRERPQNALLRLNLGLVLEAAGRRDEAAREYAEALRLAPDDPVAQLKARQAGAGGPSRAGPSARSRD
jgi:tetratricopeptide (TPR) repeat protein